MPKTTPSADLATVTAAQIRQRVDNAHCSIHTPRHRAPIYNTFKHAARLLRTTYRTSIVSGRVCANCGRKHAIYSVSDPTRLANFVVVAENNHRPLSSQILYDCFSHLRCRPI